MNCIGRFHCMYPDGIFIKEAALRVFLTVVKYDNFLTVAFISWPPHSLGTISLTTWRVLYVSPITQLIL